MKGIPSSFVTILFLLYSPTLHPVNQYAPNHIQIYNHAPLKASIKVKCWISAARSAALCSPNVSIQKTNDPVQTSIT